MVEFYRDWYENLIRHSNEKDLLVEKIADLLKGKARKNCLEIGLGTSTYFADHLSNLFKDYLIVEKVPFSGPLPTNIRFLQNDFETTPFNRKFDAILASHVVYYFRDLKQAVRKIMKLLDKGGRAYFVVNGKESDYGSLKYAFGDFIGIQYTFTYDLLMEALAEKKFRIYTAQASLSFSSYADLYEALRLSFDLFPQEYEQSKKKVVNWLEKNIKGDKFFLDQKIIEVIN